VHELREHERVQLDESHSFAKNAKEWGTQAKSRFLDSDRDL